jgi:hypothetical protein
MRGERRSAAREATLKKEDDGDGFEKDMRGLRGYSITENELEWVRRNKRRLRVRWHEYDGTTRCSAYKSKSEGDGQDAGGQNGTRRERIDAQVTSRISIVLGVIIEAVSDVMREWS